MSYIFCAKNFRSVITDKLILYRYISCVTFFFFLLFTSKSFSANTNCNLLCQTILNIQKHVTLYGGIAGGYGRMQDADASTGQSGMYRIELGSFFNLTRSIKLGSELGFQNGSQMLLTNESTSVLGDNNLPVTLYTSTPVDFLATIRIEPYQMFFFEIKGGAVHENISINGADVNTNYEWLPEVQFGAGINLNSKNRRSIVYQRFFGRSPKLVDLVEETWVSTLNGAPTMQAILLTAAINL